MSKPQCTPINARVRTVSHILQDNGVVHDAQHCDSYIIVLRQDLFAVNACRVVLIRLTLIMCRRTFGYLMALSECSPIGASSSCEGGAVIFLSMHGRLSMPLDKSRTYSLVPNP